MDALSLRADTWFPAITTLVVVLALAGCQSLPQPSSSEHAAPADGGQETVDPDYLQQLGQIRRALDELPSDPVPGNEEAYVQQAMLLRSVGDGFQVLPEAGPATDDEYRSWGIFFNRLADTVEALVNGDANLAEAERLYEHAAGLYPVFLARSNLPERPFLAVDGETSAYYAGNYYLCTMPELIADAHGRRREEGMGEHLARAMERYLDGPCEPDLMFSAAEMLYDYALVSGVDQDAYRDRIEQAGPGRSAPWLILLDNLSLAENRTQLLTNLDRALAEARASLEEGDEVSVEFADEAERQRRLLRQSSGALRTLTYRP